MDFIKFIDTYRATTFQWGKRDCCLFVADWLAEQTENDFAHDFRGKYTTELGAKRALKKLGFDGVQAVASDRLGKSVGRYQLINGDIALVKNQINEDTLGIVWGAGVWVLGLEGAEFLPTEQITKGWRLATCHQ